MDFDEKLENAIDKENSEEEIASEFFESMDGNIECNEHWSPFLTHFEEILSIYFDLFDKLLRELTNFLNYDFFDKLFAEGGIMDWLNMTPEETQAMRRIPANSHSGNDSPSG